MRSQRVLAVLMFAVLIFVFAGIVQAADTDPVTVTGILTAAGCPLTEAQQKTIAAIQPGQDRQTLTGTINGMFDEKQTAALKAKLGTTPARGNTPETVRNLTQVLILEIAKVPLTEGQLTEMNNMAANMAANMGGGGMGGGQGAPAGQGAAAQAGQGGGGMGGGGGMAGMNAVYTADQQAAITKYMGSMGGGGRGGQGGAGGGARTGGSEQ